MEIENIPENEARSRPKPPAGRRRRLSYSLGSLFVALLVVVLVASHLITSRRLFEAEQEVGALRTEAGYLTINDPNLIHVLGVSQFDALQWKWKLYLPTGFKYSLHQQSREIPLLKVPVGTGGTRLPAGEVTLEAGLNRDSSGDWRFGAKTQSFSFSTGLPAANYEWLDRPQRMSSTTQKGVGTVATSEPSEPVVLFRLRILDPQGALDQVTEGFMIWITSESDGTGKLPP